MINRPAIIQWSQWAPWKDNAQIEQDLIICRALATIYSDDFLSKELAFRGGTALHKLYLNPQLRYSEDIDLVQINPGPIKPILFRLGEILDFLPDRVTKQKRYNNTILFRTESEIPPVVPLRIKLEINCFEHFNELGLQTIPFSFENSWFKGNCNVTTYALDELLGTKLRALYQRKKGRDLFDLYIAVKNHYDKIDVDRIIRCYNRYMEFVVTTLPTRKQFILNMEEKMHMNDFLCDTELLLRKGEDFNPEVAYELVKEQLIDLLP